MRRRPALVAAALSAGVLLTSCSTIDPNAATVNGDEINRRDFEDDLHAMADNPTFVAASGQPVDGELVGSVSTLFAAQELTDRIMASLVAEEVDNRRLTVDPVVTDAAAQVAPQVVLGTGGTEQDYLTLPESFRRSVEQATAERFTLGLDLNDLTAADLPDYIEEQGLAYRDDVCLFLVPTASEEDAEAALDGLAAGATFTDMVTEYSAEPGLVADDGAILRQDGSCLSGNEIPPEILDPLSAEPLGTDVGPIEFDQFFLVARVTTVGEVSPTATSTALVNLSAPTNEAFGAWMTGAAEAAEVDVDPRYGRWDASVPGVLSPLAAPAPAT